MKTELLPIPVDADLNSLVRQAAGATGLKMADVMRQGLRHGVPAFVQRLRAANQERPPACLKYLDEYPPSQVRAKGFKAELRRKLGRKYDRANR
ncbi:MAG: hypothetical protein HYY23_12870 [Verrucomicrobia bacterium]|nr:hypothetical protein [Verrucomicrobiota bacterium]